MITGAFLLEILLRGLAIGVMAAMALGLRRAAARVRWTAALAALGVSGFAIADCRVLSEASLIPWWGPSLLASGVVGYVWLFVLAVFEDRPMSPRLAGPAALLTALGMGALALRLEPLALLRDMVSAALALHALSLVLRSWRGDLIEARRRLRAPFFAAVTVYIVAETAMDALGRNGFSLPWSELASAALLALLCLGAAAVFLDDSQGLFGPPAVRRARSAPDADLAALARAMDVEQAWRTEGLTVAALASSVGVPEHRLRRRIHDELGFRNFAAFVNSRRIEAAKAALAEPTLARGTIAALAFDLGFGSLGPFNRAFKEATGLTPRQWREQACAGESFAEIANTA